MQYFSAAWWGKGLARRMPRSREFVGVFVATTWLVLGLLLAAPATTKAQPTGGELPGLEAVVDQLREGGLVIYFRHAISLSTNSDEGAVMERCDTQRNLSAAGREQASQIGKAIKALRINIGPVATSPFCRCKDTAQLAFGHYAVDQNLFFSLATNTDATHRQAQIQALRSMLATSPPKGTNAVIVGHTANLRDATGLWPKPEGGAFVFRPHGNGQFDAVARVVPEDWTRVATTHTK